MWAERPPTVERKFTASRHRLEEALAQVGQFADPDPRFPAGRIRSIYFDSPRLRAFDEKLAGDFLKRKVRARWYESPSDPVPVFFEIKCREGGGRRKERVRVDLPRVRLLNSDLSDEHLRLDLLGGAGSLRAEVPTDFVPMLDLAYERRRFVCRWTGARMCLDWDIRVVRFRGSILPGAALPVLPEIVFEFKDIGQGEIPWLGDLAHAGFMARSFSKYGECVRRILEGPAPV